MYVDKIQQLQSLVVLFMSNLSMTNVYVNSD